MEVRLSNQLPVYPSFVPGIRRAPDRGYSLTPAQTETALKNALRYIPEELHEVLAPEFMEELMTRGRIYGYRYRPEGDLKAKPVDQYKGQCLEGKAFQVMIDNNLSFDIALYPYELVTYGETGQVCQNWMQYRLIKQYLEILTSEQTLVIESGHPLGLFRSKPDAPRVIITNSMMVGLFDNQKDWHIAAQMGVANYGQMTAGGWMYIGPQGIVHGTFNTLLNAGRKKLGIPQDQDLRGQDRDNYNWIRDAETNRLVVGTEARILYQDAEGRLNIALRFNRMVRDGEVGPIMLGRDHHDVSGTDSPFRETSNIYDGSNVMADMAVQCFAGNAARGMSLVALHNGGGVGIGKAVNGGFGMVLDGSERVDEILRSAMLWDVMGGVARRSWARNPNAMSTSAAFNENYGDWYHITLPFIPKEDLIQNSIRTSLKRKV